MKRFCATVVLACTLASANAAPPSDASILEMMQVMQVERSVEQMMAQLDQGMAQSMDQAVRQSTKGSEPTPEQRRTIEMHRQKMMAVFREELSYDKLKDLYMQVYRETFTQEEVNGIVAFCRTPVGKSFVEKTPVVMQKAGTLMQSRMAPFMQKLSELQEQMARDLAKSQ